MFSTPSTTEKITDEYRNSNQKTLSDSIIDCLLQCAGDTRHKFKCIKCKTCISVEP